MLLHLTMDSHGNRLTKLSCGQEPWPVNDPWFDCHFKYWVYCRSLDCSITLLRIEKDNKMYLAEHIRSLYKKNNHQLNALSHIHKYIGFREMKMLLDSFMLSNFNYCYLVWNFYWLPCHTKKYTIRSGTAHHEGKFFAEIKNHSF